MLSLELWSLYLFLLPKFQKTILQNRKVLLTIRKLSVEISMQQFRRWDRKLGENLRCNLEDILEIYPEFLAKRLEKPRDIPLKDYLKNLKSLEFNALVNLHIAFYPSETLAIAARSFPRVDMMSGSFDTLDSEIWELVRHHVDVFDLEDDWPGVLDLPRCRWLKINSSAVKEIQAPQLTQLSVYFGRQSSEHGNLKEILKSSRLKKIFLEGKLNAEDLEPVFLNSNVEELLLNDRHLKTADLTAMTNLRKLTMLYYFQLEEKTAFPVKFPISLEKFVLPIVNQGSGEVYIPAVPKLRLQGGGYDWFVKRYDGFSNTQLLELTDNDPDKFVILEEGLNPWIVLNKHPVHVTYRDLAENRDFARTNYSDVLKTREYFEFLHNLEDPKGLYMPNLISIDASLLEKNRGTDTTLQLYFDIDQFFEEFDWNSNERLRELPSVWKLKLLKYPRRETLNIEKTVRLLQALPVLEQIVLVHDFPIFSERGLRYILNKMERYITISRL